MGVPWQRLAVIGVALGLVFAVFWSSLGGGGTAATSASPTEGGREVTEEEDAAVRPARPKVPATEGDSDGRRSNAAVLPQTLPLPPLWAAACVRHPWSGDGGRAVLAAVTVTNDGVADGDDAREPYAPANATTTTTTTNRLSSRVRFPSFAALVDDVLASDHSPATLAAVYDAGVPYAAMASFAAGNRDYFGIEGLTWNLAKRRAQAERCKTFGATREGQLTFIKKHVSMGIGRMHRDAALERLFRSLKGNAMALQAMRSAVSRVVAAYVDVAFTALQLVVDGSGARDPLRERKDLLAQMQHLTLTRHANRPWPRRGGRRAALRNDHRYLDYAAPGYDQQPPRNGKFWSMLRPSLHCSGVTRLCEQPDGCRLLCNAAYLLNAVAAPLHFAGFGSNNEYEWEESLVRTFVQQVPASSGTAATEGAARSIVGSIATFDCTLKNNNKWLPPATITRPPVGFTAVGKCLDEKPSEMSIVMGQLRSLLTGVVATQQGPSPAVAVALGNETLSVLRGAVLPSVAAPQRLAILKMDVEGYEYLVAPQWLRDDVRALARQQRQPRQHRTSSDAPNDDAALGIPASLDSAPLLDTACMDSFLAVDNMQMEFHRMGHRYPHGSSLSSAQHAHRFVLTLAALGLLMVGQDRNHIDNCCYEFSFTHARYFVESETWLALRQ